MATVPRRAEILAALQQAWTFLLSIVGDLSVSPELRFRCWREAREIGAVLWG